MRTLSLKDCTVMLPTSKFIAVGVSRAVVYEDGKATDRYDGYHIDVVSPELPGVGFTIKVKDISEGVEAFKSVRFDDIEVTAYAPKEWDVRVKVTASKAHA